MVASGPEGELDRLALELLVEGLGVERTGAFIEQRHHHAGDAGLVERVLGGAAGKGEVDGDQRHRGIAHQPGLDAARADHALDRHRLGRRGVRQHGAGDERGRHAGAEAAENGGHGRAHERFSSGRVSLIR